MLIPAVSSSLLSTTFIRRLTIMDHEAEELGIPAHAQRADEVVLPTTAAERKRVLNILAQRRYRKYQCYKIVCRY